MELSPTKLDYFDDMWKLHSNSTLLSFFEITLSPLAPSISTTTIPLGFYHGDDDRRALILASTIFHPQGGGQPSDTGYIAINIADLNIKFIIEDVRSKEGIVFHYGYIESSEVCEPELNNGKEVLLYVDELRRKLNSRLHSAGHLLDVCMPIVGLAHFEPCKGYHFPDGPFVEHKGTLPQNELQSKQKELELVASKLISRGGKVTAAVLPYEEACKQCGGCLPDYIPKSSTPRIVKLGDNPGCPCGGTHVSDVSEIISLKVTQIRTKKGMTKVSYTVGS